MYFGAYFGSGGTGTTIIVVSSAPTVTPVASPYTPAEPEYVDLTEIAVERLCMYAREKASE